MIFSYFESQDLILFGERMYCSIGYMAVLTRTILILTFEILEEIFRTTKKV